MRVECAITHADQPLGYAIGPALEAREALQALTNPTTAPNDLIDKALSLAAILLKMVKKGDRNLANHLLQSGAAEKKFREIVAAQGGNGKIRPKDIDVEKKAKRAVVRSTGSGEVGYISNKTLVNIARLAGAPKDIFSGILLRKKLHDAVKSGEPLYTIYAEKPFKLRQAISMAKNYSGYEIYTPKRHVVMEKINEDVERQRSNA